MGMTIQDIPAGRLVASQTRQIVALLRECDADFVPPLSARRSVTQDGFTDVNDTTQRDAVLAYYAAVLEQSCLIMTESGTDDIG